MSAFVNMIFADADYFILILLRVGGLVISSPIFGRVNIPQRVKICLIVAVSYLFYTVFPQTVELQYTTLLGFLLVCAGEVLLGIALAFVTNIFFALTAFTAGQLIDMQVGYGIVNVYDIQNNTQAPMMGNVLNLMLLMIFFAVNGHLTLINIVYMTVERMPVGSLVFSPGIGLTALEIFAKAFLLGVMMALPIIASGLTLEILLGVLMRLIPQIHMFVVGVPLKMLVGLTVFAATLPVFAGFSSRVFSDMFSGIEYMFAQFVPN